VSTDDALHSEDDALDTAPEDALGLEIAFHGAELPVEIVPAGRWRPWMEATSNRFANRCLPLLIANQAGWWLLNPADVEVTWQGGDDKGTLKVVYDDEVPKAQRIAKSHFGYGIVSFSFKCFVQTPQGFNLHVRGPANMPKDGVAALDALIETDWALVPFTMSWKLTRPGTVRFEAGEPFCQIVPQRRGELERFVPTQRNLDEEPAASQQARAWEQTRLLYQVGKHKMHDAGDESYQRRWMDDYFRGQSPSGERNTEHQTTLRLKPL
jgi:hypothetical protein